MAIFDTTPIGAQDSVTSQEITKIQVLDLSEYQAIENPDPNTLYLIRG